MRMRRSCARRALVLISYLVVCSFALAEGADPSRARQFIAEGIRLVQQERLAEAADRFRKAMAADPSNADAANDLGIVLRRQRAFQDAIAAFETARRLRP